MVKQQWLYFLLAYLYINQGLGVDPNGNNSNYHQSILTTKEVDVENDVTLEGRRQFHNPEISSWNEIGTNNLRRREERKKTSDNDEPSESVITTTRTVTRGEDADCCLCRCFMGQCTCECSCDEQDDFVDDDGDDDDSNNDDHGGTFSDDKNDSTDDCGDLDRCEDDQAQEDDSKNVDDDDSTAGGDDNTESGDDTEGGDDNSNESADDTVSDPEETDDDVNLSEEDDEENSETSNGDDDDTMPGAPSDMTNPNQIPNPPSSKPMSTPSSLHGMGSRHPAQKMTSHAPTPHMSKPRPTVSPAVASMTTKTTSPLSPADYMYSKPSKPSMNTSNMAGTSRPSPLSSSRSPTIVTGVPVMVPEVFSPTESPTSKEPSHSNKEYEILSCESLPLEAKQIVLNYTFVLRTVNEIPANEVVSNIENDTLDAVSLDLLSCKLDNGRRLSSVYGVSAAPEDRVIATCGNGCSEVYGGMTIYSSEESISNSSNTLCHTIRLINDTMSELMTLGLYGIDDILIRFDGMNLECNDDESEDLIPASATSFEAAAGGFPVTVVTLTVLAVCFAMFALAYLLLRYRRSSRSEVTDAIEVDRHQNDLIGDVLTFDDGKPGSALAISALGSGGHYAASSKIGFEGDGNYRASYEKGFENGFAASFLDNKQKKASQKRSVDDLLEDARELGYDQQLQSESYSRGYFGGYAAGAASRGYSEGITASQGKSKQKRKSIPFVIIEKNARSLGYVDKDDIDAFCSGYFAGNEAELQQAKGRDNDEVVSAFGRAYHDGFFDAVSKKKSNALAEDNLEARVQLLGYKDSESCNAYFDGYDAGFFNGEERKMTTCAANAASRGYFDGYAAGASGVRTYNNVTPRELLKKASALGLTTHEEIAGYCVGYRSGFLGAKMNSLSINAAPISAVAFGTGYFDGITDGNSKGKEHDAPNVQETLEKAENRGFKEKESKDAYSAGYRGGINAGEAKRDISIASFSAERGFRHGFDTALNGKREPSLSEIIRQARSHGSIEADEIIGYSNGFGVGFHSANQAVHLDDSSIKARSKRVHSLAFSKGYFIGCLDGLSHEQGDAAHDSKLKDKSRSYGIVDKEILQTFSGGYRCGFTSGEARRLSVSVSNAFEKGLLDSQQDSSQGLILENFDSEDSKLMETARAHGFTEKQAIEAYSIGVRTMLFQRKNRTWGNLGGSKLTDGEQLSNSFGQGFQIGYIFCADEVSTKETDNLAKSSGLSKLDEIEAYGSGVSLGRKTLEFRTLDRKSGSASVDNVSDAYTQGYEDGFACGLSYLNGERKDGDVEQRHHAQNLSRPELEVKALGLGYSNQSEIDKYCSGFWTGYIAVQGKERGLVGSVVQSLCNVHKCSSSSCTICRSSKLNEPTFISTGEHFIPEI